MAARPPWSAHMRRLQVSNGSDQRRAGDLRWGVWLGQETSHNALAGGKCEGGRQTEGPSPRALATILENSSEIAHTDRGNGDRSGRMRGRGVRCSVLGSWGSAGTVDLKVYTGLHYRAFSVTGRRGEFKSGCFGFPCQNDGGRTMKTNAMIGFFSIIPQLSYRWPRGLRRSG